MVYADSPDPAETVMHPLLQMASLAEAMRSSLRTSNADLSINVEDVVTRGASLEFRTDRFRWLPKEGGAR
jgi:hypothetical protein